MHSLLGLFGSLRAELIFTAVLLVILTIIMLYEYHQKELVKKAKDSEEAYTEPENIYRK